MDIGYKDSFYHSVLKDIEDIEMFIKYIFTLIKTMDTIECNRLEKYFKGIKYDIQTDNLSYLIFTKDTKIDSTEFNTLKNIYNLIDNTKSDDTLKKYFIKYLDGARIIIYRIWYNLRKEKYGKTDEFYKFVKISLNMIKEIEEIEYMNILKHVLKIRKILIKNDDRKQEYKNKFNSNCCDYPDNRGDPHNGYIYDSGEIWYGAD